MYVDVNFRSKKAFREAVKEGDVLHVYNPSGMFPAPLDGEVSIEGPHYPQPHTWYARVKIEQGAVVKVIS